MTEEIKKNSDIMDGQGETDDDDFEHDPEKDGQVYLYDPQNNEITENEKISQYFRNTVELSIINLTNTRSDEKFCDNIMQKEKDKNETRGKKYI